MDHFELASALRGVVSDLHKRLRKQTYSADELSLTEVTTISYLYKQGPMYPSELAEVNKIRKQSMSQVLSRLQELKLIRRVTSKTDKRKTVISLTAAGERIVDKTRSERDEWLAGAIGEMVTEKDIQITKKTWNAFYDTPPDEELKRIGVTGIVLCGIATSIGVEGTARAAYERGYNLSFASDAMTDMVGEFCWLMAGAGGGPCGHMGSFF